MKVQMYQINIQTGKQNKNTDFFDPSFQKKSTGIVVSFPKRVCKKELGTNQTTKQGQNYSGMFCGWAVLKKDDSAKHLMSCSQTCCLQLSSPLLAMGVKPKQNTGQDDQRNCYVSSVQRRIWNNSASCTRFMQERQTTKPLLASCKNKHNLLRKYSKDMQITEENPTRMALHAMQSMSLCPNWKGQ